MLNKLFWVLLLAIPFFMAIPANATAEGLNFPQYLSANLEPIDPGKQSFVQKMIPQAFTLQGNNSKLKNSAAEVELITADKRVRILKAYLVKYNSPMQSQAGSFVAAADKYDLDWRLVAAIAGVESTFGKFTPGNDYYPSYNAWGWGVYGDQAIYFKSWEDGIYTVSQGLRENYINRGLTDPLAINRIYAASPTWGTHVNYFLADMDKFQRSYEEREAAQLIPSIMPYTAGSSGLLAMAR